MDDSLRYKEESLRKKMDNFRAEKKHFELYRFLKSHQHGFLNF